MIGWPRRQEAERTCQYSPVNQLQLKTYYITTTLPYVNDRPHIGHALEFVQADAIARYRRLQGYDVILNFGTDEHGEKIYRKALEAGKDPQAYVDEYAATFDALKKVLNFSYDKFIRTTDPAHIAAAREFWKICAKKGDIYKKFYKIKYCIGCELEKTDSELKNNRCPLHPNLEIEAREEENYFFKFSDYQNSLTNLYNERPDFVVPAFRLNEMKSLISGEGFQDFSISRLKAKMPWGIPVPDDEEHVMYVWFDALINYVSTIGWPEDMERFEKYWPVVQFAGKDNLRQQSAMWQAMLMSAGLPSSKQIVIHGFIVGEGGVKMSKSLGNVVDPYAVVHEYGTDALRYFLLRHVNPFEDSEFVMGKFREAYNANLANGLGNLVSRIMKMAETYNVKPELPNKNEATSAQEVFKSLENYKFNEAMNSIWREIHDMDLLIQEGKPFNLIKTDEGKAKEIIGDLVKRLWGLAINLEPLMPETSEKIQELVAAGKSPETPLFPRK
ncbi:MAG: methionine--tRNA ligase [Candidatus Colwellbacteria bacterium]|nr:methionine--tRNA ligase [Candidatus Colwellbacteria bacterium]